MSENLLICQLSDMHFIDSDKKLNGQVNTKQQFIKAINFCNSLDPQPDIFIMSGDLIHDNPNFYDKFIELSNKLQKPYYLMIGNHDHRNRLTKIISNKKLVDKYGYINFSIDEFPIRIIAIDTVIDKTNGGEISSTTFYWLKNELDRDLKKPTIIFMHHPPINIGSIVFDNIKCINGSKFLQLTSNYKNIIKIIFGHIHCKFKKNFLNQELMSCPSSAFQIFIKAKTTENLKYDNQGYIQLYNWGINKQLNVEAVKIL